MVLVPADDAVRLAGAAGAIVSTAKARLCTDSALPAPSTE